MINDFFQLNRLFARNMYDQLLGSQESIRNFLPRQQLKIKAYFTLVSFWQSLIAEMDGGSIDPRSLEEGGAVYELYEKFQEDMKAIFHAFEEGVDYSEEGLFERWRDGFGQLINRAILGSGGAIYKELEFEFEQFWIHFFQLVRTPPPPPPPKRNEIRDTITTRASNYLKIKTFGLEPEFLRENQEDLATRNLKQKVQSEYMLDDPIITSWEAREAATGITERILPVVLNDSASMFNQSTNGLDLLSIYDRSGRKAGSFDDQVRRELEIEYRYLLQLAIGYSRVLYQALGNQKETAPFFEKYLDGESATREILEQGRSLALTAASPGTVAETWVNTEDNGLNSIHFPPFDSRKLKTKASQKKYAIQIESLQPVPKISELPDLRRAAHFSLQFMQSVPNFREILMGYFRGYKNQLPVNPADEPAVINQFGEPVVTVNDLAKKLIYKPLWANDQAWLERSVDYAISQIDTIDSVLVQLEKNLLNDSSKTGESFDPLSIEVADKLSLVYTYRTTLEQETPIREALINGIQEQLAGRTVADLSDTHKWAAETICMHLKNILMHGLANSRISNRLMAEVKLDHLATDYQRMFPNWDRAMHTHFFKPLSKKLAFTLDLQLGHVFPEYKAAQAFNYRQDYDKSTFEGVMGSFLRAISDALKQNFTLR